MVYEYSLAKALVDGKYVKNPAIAKRKDFNPKGIDEKQIEIIKLEDAISVHEDTKHELDVYSRNEDVKLVKPFILVVCKDTTHAKEIYEMINSDEFYDGAYKDKVLQIDSTTKREGGIEEQFLGLEEPDNQIEIVIHVNMLKEGWDVTNLYTIVPLRAANAAVLVEQTIGRGLRLPFDGKRTGIDKIDKLTVIAHENFDQVIKAAQDPNSILNKLNFVELAEEDLQSKTEVITSKSVSEVNIASEQKKVDKITDVKEKQRAQNILDAKQAIIYVLPEFNSVPGVTKVDDLRKEDVKRRVIKKVEENLSKGQLNIFAGQIVADAEQVYEVMVNEYKKNIIEIPRMDLVQMEAQIRFEHFDLDTSELTYQALDEEIIRMGLKDRIVDTISAKASGYYGDPVKLIIAEVINYPEVDYDDNTDLLYHLATQAYETLKQNLDHQEDISKVVFQFKSAIAEKIYNQMKTHHKITATTYGKPNVLPFVRIEPWNFSALVTNGYKDYREIITPDSAVKRYVFRGFEKACHFEYKFDSKTEQDMAFILENEKNVLKWLRPAPNQFRIYWDNNSKRYEPDFIVETADCIYMLEPKMASEVNDAEVLAKAEAAKVYCTYATEFTAENSGKPWNYGIIPHTAVNRTASLGLLISKFVK